MEKSNGTLYWTGIGSDALAESDLSGNMTEQYVFFNGMRVSREDYSTGNTHAFLGDHLGSLRMMVTPASATTLKVEQDTDYTPYGIVATGTAADHYEFTGKERDAESGLDEFGARYYASSLGRFMIPDWAEKPTDVPYASFGNPQSLNLYSYVNNNPTTTRDPDGHCCDDDEIDFGVGVLRGVASSMSFGIVGAPKASDSTASIIGQLTGTAMVGAGGEMTKDAGAVTVGASLVAELPSGGTSTVGVLGGERLWESA